MRDTNVIGNVFKNRGQRFRRYNCIFKLGIDIIHLNEDFYINNDEFIHSSESCKVLVTLKAPPSHGCHHDTTIFTPFVFFPPGTST